ncbi:hypothetical protein CEUSTIGMA_g8715.t1 [Chlamydomonas eustigma]|uniref:Equilibrative nucleoside transporter n=1 Tax=Chlamydomonas eustigma TaxID=1157962 RepID=A0A250XDX5_9CHLO|nr:hypothetical protein CEUSTIGMA_g8715.t1 [Chlamydomonas eustigma]|eukprot:GAX81283.1 hypothetical protein CEUSTIGMA_g8715.t1 [Chlamydomonas eustigma]
MDHVIYALSNFVRRLSLRETVAFGCYFILGAAFLAPWNAYLTAIDYFAAVYGVHMDRLFSICYLTMCLLLLVLMMHFGPGVVELHTRITVGYSGFLALTVLVPMVDVFFVSESPRAPDSALAMVLASVLMTGVLDGVSQPAVFVDAALAGPTYTHAVVGGTACSGVLVCLLRIVTKASFPDTLEGLRAGTDLYFGAAGVLSALGLVIHLIVLPRLGIRRPVPVKQAQDSGLVELSSLMQISRAQPQRQRHPRLPLSTPPAHTAPLPHTLYVLEEGEEARFDNQPLMRRSEGLLRGSRGGSGGGSDEVEDYDEPVTQAILEEGEANSSSRAAAEASRSSRLQQLRIQVEQDKVETKLRYRRMAVVARHCWRCLLAVFVTYVTTLSIFPGVLGEDVHSVELGSWYPLLLITLFNVSDVVGKILPIRQDMWLQRQHLLLAAAAARTIVLLPLMVVSAVQEAPVYIMALQTTLLGITNGYLTALTMTLAPSYAAQIFAGVSSSRISTASRPLVVSQAGYQRVSSDGGDQQHPAVGGVGLLQSSSAGVEVDVSGHDGDGMMAEELSVLSLVSGLTVGAIMSWVWLAVSA